MFGWKGKPDEATLLKRRTIMHVDDDMPLLRSTKSLLEKQGYVVITCANGLEAVETYKEKHEDVGLILLDVKMPKMSGCEAFNELLKINPDVRAIIVSGYARDILVRECLDAGALAFLGKPFMKAELYALVEKHIADA